jgi:hypothetical protein
MTYVDLKLKKLVERVESLERENNALNLYKRKYEKIVETLEKNGIYEQNQIEKMLELNMRFETLQIIYHMAFIFKCEYLKI